jgi:hypothetical protein
MKMIPQQESIRLSVHDLWMWSKDDIHHPTDLWQWIDGLHCLDLKIATTY